MGDRSPFRANFLKVEIFISGAWINVTSDLSDDGVSIQRGKADESGEIGPSSASLRLKNSTGKYSPRNPNSPHYGYLVRNTPIRISTEHTAGQVVYRFWGEVHSWPQGWGRTGSASAFADLECAGALRRLGQGASPLRSPLYRVLSSRANIVGYWPMEEESSATRFTPAKGTGNITWTGTPSIGAYSGVPSSEPLTTLQDARLDITFPRYTATDAAQVMWVMGIPAGTPNNAVLASIYFTGGTLARVDFRYETAGGGIAGEGFSTSGASLGGTSLPFGVDSKNLFFVFRAQQSGTSVVWAFGRYDTASTAGSFFSWAWNSTTIGTVASMQVNPARLSLGDAVFGHVTAESSPTNMDSVGSQTLQGWTGEYAGDRIQRLCTENGMTSSTEYVGPRREAEKMGVQRPAKLSDLLRQAEATSGGLLFEPRDSGTDLRFRSLESMFLTNQSPVNIVFQDNLLRPFEPVEDDQATRNQVTVSRAGGGSATVTQTSGNLGTGVVGIYDESVTLSLPYDDMTDHQASWRLRLGTVDEARWPRIGFHLEDSYWFSNTTLRAQVLNMDLGDWLRVTNLPSWLPPFPVEAIVLGYSENITPLEHEIVFNLGPSSPYFAMVYNNPSTRFSGVGTTLAAAITATQNTFTVSPPAGVQWTSADGQYEILVGGEVMNVVDVTGNTFTVSRSLNGVVKTHPAGRRVDLNRPAYYGL